MSRRSFPLILTDATWERLDALAPLYAVGDYQTKLYDYLPGVVLVGLAAEEARLAQKVGECPPAAEQTPRK